MSPNVLFEIEGPEAVITLNRPAKRNAYDRDMIDAIACIERGRLMETDR